jgi:positive regulator of sigma E activity
MAGSGILFAVVPSFFLFSHRVSPEIKGHHIHYALGFKGGLFKSASLLYFIPTILPPFVSGLKSVRFLDVFLLISYAVSKLYFADSVVSVWCFIATFCSFIVLRALKEIRATEFALEPLS